MRDCGEPFPAEAFVGAGGFGEALGCTRGVKEGPLKAVGEKVVLEVDGEGDDAAVGVVGVVESVGGVCWNYGAGGGDFGRGGVGVGSCESWAKGVGVAVDVSERGAGAIGQGGCGLFSRGGCGKDGFRGGAVGGNVCSVEERM